MIITQQNDFSHADQHNVFPGGADRTQSGGTTHLFVEECLTNLDYAQRSKHRRSGHGGPEGREVVVQRVALCRGDISV